MGTQTLSRRDARAGALLTHPSLLMRTLTRETSCALATGPARLSCMCGPCCVCGDSFRAVSLGPTVEGNGQAEPDKVLAWDASSSGA